MELLLWIAIVAVVLVVTLTLVRRNGIGASAGTRRQRMSRELGDSLEARYQADRDDGGSPGR